MRYQIPQFIEIEDKLIGPFSLKQFLYLIAVPSLCYLLHFFVKLPYVILVGVIFFPLSLLLAFCKINGRPFIYAVLNFFRYALKPQLYLWKKVPKSVSRGPQKPLSKKKKREKQEKEIRAKELAVKDFGKLAEILDRPEK